MLDAVIYKNHFSWWNILFMLEMERMNGLFIPLQKGAWNLREFRCKIPAYPGFFVHAEKPGKSMEKPGVAGLWKSLESQENIFHAFQASPYVQKSLERPRKPGALIFSWLSGLFRFFFWKGPGQLVFLDLILINICFIIKYFIVMCSKLVLFFSQRKSKKTTTHFSDIDYNVIIRIHVLN